MQGLNEIKIDNANAHNFVGVAHLPNENVRQVLRETSEAITETVTQVTEYRNDPQRADDFAFGFVRGVFAQLRRSNDPATAAFAGIMLAQVNAGGVGFVKTVLSRVNGR
jgi:hypothetical protein